MRYLIYGLVDPRSGSVRYIGKSSSGLRRPAQHSAPSFLEKDETYKGRWVKRLLREGLTYIVRVLEIVDDPLLLDDVERFWIAQAKGLDWPLTNLTKGGDGCLGRVPSEKQRQSVRLRNKSEVWTPERREKVAVSRRGKKLPVETRLKMSTSRLGRPLPIDAEARRRAVATIRQRLGSPFKDNTGRVYASLAEAAEELGLTKTAIQHVLKGRNKTAGGRTFEYAHKSHEQVTPKDNEDAT